MVSEDKSRSFVDSIELRLEGEPEDREKRLKEIMEFKDNKQRQLSSLDKNVSELSDKIMEILNQNRSVDPDKKRLRELGIFRNLSYQNKVTKDDESVKSLNQEREEH